TFDLQYRKVRSLIPASARAMPQGALFMPEAGGVLVKDFDTSLADVYRICGKNMIGCVFGYGIQIRLMINNAVERVYACSSLDKLETVLHVAGIYSKRVRVYVRGRPKDTSTRVYQLGNLNGVRLKVFC
ncbi:hypothetical protein IWW54_006180, partial [Coemansia sp. RSA 2705]